MYVLTFLLGFTFGGLIVTTAAWWMESRAERAASLRSQAGEMALIHQHRYPELSYTQVYDMIMEELRKK